MELKDKIDGSKFKFEYLKDRKIGRFFITDKDGCINIFDMPHPELMKFFYELKSELALSVQRVLLKAFINEVDPTYEADIGYKFRFGTIDDFLNKFNKQKDEKEN